MRAGLAGFNDDLAREFAVRGEMFLYRSER